MTGHLYGRCWLAITARDLVVLGCCILYEHYSLKAFVEICRAWRGVWTKRRWIMERKRVSDDYIAAWFRYHPVSRQPPIRAPAQSPRPATRLRS